MNHENNIGIEVLEIYTEKQKLEKEYSEKLYTFLTSAYELVELSEDMYQVERTIELNKIILKYYVLNSDVCLMLKENHIENYYIEDLKKYMEQYESQNISDITPYKLALNLYELLESIEDIENNKIEYEIERLSKILPELNNIKNIDKEQYQNLYMNLTKYTKEKYIDYKYTLRCK